MEKSFIIAGFGGQGVMVMGQLLSYTACETTEKYVTYFPSYDAEMRGGTANCYVVISDDPVGAPKVSQADYVVVLNDPSMAKFKNAVVPGGTIFVTALSSRWSPTATMSTSSRWMPAASPTSWATRRC